MSTAGRRLFRTHAIVLGTVALVAVIAGVVLLVWGTSWNHQHVSITASDCSYGSCTPSAVDCGTPANDNHLGLPTSGDFANAYQGALTDQGEQCKAALSNREGTISTLNTVGWSVGGIGAALAVAALVAAGIKESAA